MKPTALLILLLIILWAINEHHTAIPALALSAQPKQLSVDYRNRLRSITEYVFDPFHKPAPHPAGELLSIMSMATADSKAGLITKKDATNIRMTCLALYKVNRYREEYGINYERTRMRINNGQNVEYFIYAHLVKWDGYVGLTRPPILKAISRLPTLHTVSTNKMNPKLTAELPASHK